MSLDLIVIWTTIFRAIVSSTDKSQRECVFICLPPVFFIQRSRNGNALGKWTCLRLGSRALLFSLLNFFGVYLFVICIILVQKSVKNQIDIFWRWRGDRGIIKGVSTWPLNPRCLASEPIRTRIFARVTPAKFYFIRGIQNSEFSRLLFSIAKFLPCFGFSGDLG